MKVSQEFQLTEDDIRALDEVMFEHGTFSDLVMGSSSMYAIQNAVLACITIDMTKLSADIMVGDKDII